MANATTVLVHPVHHNHIRQASSKQPLLRTTISVIGIPSVTFQNDRLIVYSSQTSCTRSYTPVKVLGDGCSGTVLLCDWHRAPNIPLSPMQCGVGARPDWAGMRLVAVKRIKKKWEGGWGECQKLKELQALRAIPYHPNIIPLYDFFFLPDTKELYFVFESMEGNLHHLIKARKGRFLAGGLVSHIFVQIVEGLHHIHTYNYFHLDIQPENVLVTTTGLYDYTSVSPTAPPNAPKEKDVVAIIKLADFGLARETNSPPPYTEYVCNRWYLAPEVLLSSGDYSKPVDMWALGTTMAELVNLKPLFPGSDQVDQVARICEVLGDPSDRLDDIAGAATWSKGEKLAKSLGFQFPKVPPKDLYSLFGDTVPRSLVDCIQNLLRYDPDRRLTSQQCRTHPYLLETLPRNRITDTQDPLSSPSQKSVAVEKRQEKVRLEMSPGEKSRQPPPPVDETSPNLAFQMRKRSQSDGIKSKQQLPPVRIQPQDPRGVAATKKEAQRLHREAELEKRKILEHNAREQARAVLLKRQQELNNDDCLGWKTPTDTEIRLIRRAYKGRDANLCTVTAAPGKFVAPNVHELPPERDRREWRGGPSAPEARRRAFDDGSTSSDDDDSSDAHTIKISSNSLATVDSDTGPTRLRNQPTVTSRSSLRTSFDEFPPSARTSDPYSYERQLAHDFETGACEPNPIFRVPDNHVPDTIHDGEKSRQHLLPVDDVAFQLRKRSQSDGTKSMRLRKQSLDPCDVTTEAQPLHQGAELEQRKMVQYHARGLARAVLLKCQQMLRKDVVAIGDYMTRSDVIFEEHYESDACSLFSVLSVDTQSRSIQSSVGVHPDDSSDTVYWSLNSYNISGNETDQDSSPRGWDKQSVISRETFETAQEPPPELLSALGLYLDPISPTVPMSNELSHAESSGHFKGGSKNECPEEPLDPTTNSKNTLPVYSTSFIRDVSNVCITGSQIEFTTNIVHHDDSVRVGLHTLYLRSDPTGLRNSYERQKRVNQQMKTIRSWGSQLLITSPSTRGAYQLSVPSIQTHDLQEVVKEVLTWIYSASSPQSIMWLHDEENEGNCRTSLIGQCLADFLSERRDLTASYFYTKHSPVFTAGTSCSGTDGSGDSPSSIVPTIAYDLTRRIPEIKIPIALTAANDHWIFDLSLDEQMKTLIVDPLLAASNILDENSDKFPLLFLIHGLEDCNDDDFQELFLRGFGKSLTLLQERIPQKLLLLGRQTTCLREYFSKPGIQETVRHQLLPVCRDNAPANTVC